MADVEVSALISLGLDAQKAEQGVKALRDIQRGMDDARKKADETRRAFGETVGRAGAAFSGVAGLLGNTALGGGLGTAGNALGAAENIKNFKAQLQALSEGMANAGGVSGKLAGAVGGLGTVLGPAAVAAAAVTVAVGVYINTIKAQSDAIASYTRVQKEYFDLLTSGTTEQAKAQLKAAQDSIKSLERQRTALQGKLAESFAADTQQTLGDLGARIRTGARDIFDGGWKEAKTALENIDKQLLDNKTKVELLSGALKDNALATNDAIEREKKLAQERLAAIDVAMTAEIDYANFLRTATPESGRERIEELKIQAAALANAYSKALDDPSQEGKEKAEKLRVIYEKVNGTIADLTNLLPQVDARFLTLTSTLKAFEAELAAATAADDMGARGGESRLLTRGSEDDYRERRAGAMSDYTSISEQLAERQITTARRRAQQEEQDAIDAQRAGVEASFAKRIAAVKERQAEQERVETIAKLRTDAAKVDARALHDFQQQEQKAAQDYQKQNEQALAGMYRQRDQINAAYMASELKAVEDFNRAQAQAQAAGMKERIRFTEDWQDRLNGAMADRDVARFIEEQKAGEKQLRRMTEDADEATKAQTDQFLRERETARTARDEQLADLQASFEQERAARQTEYEEQRAEQRANYEQARIDRQADLEERIAQEREAGQQRQDQAQALEEELAKLREQWAAEDKARREQAEKDAENAELAVLREKHKKALDELNLYLDMENQAKVKHARQAVEDYGSVRNIPSHAGGLDSVPYDGYVAMLHKGERVVPAAQNTGGMVTVNVDMTVGDVASGAMVRGELNSLASTIANIWRQR